jgi:integrase
VVTEAIAAAARALATGIQIFHRSASATWRSCKSIATTRRVCVSPGGISRWHFSILRRTWRGHQPFTADQLAKLRQAAGDDMLAFLLLRHTGFRGSDAVGLRLGEIDWDTHEINRLTLKRRKRVMLPIHSELFFALEAERDRRGPDPDPEERLLMNPATGRPLTRPRLYQRMLALGKRAGVLDSHPHRFRDTFAVDFLAKGGSPYDVAKLLGDTVETIERHYAPFVRELRERARGIMETGKGLEMAGTPRAQDKMPEGKPN